MYDIPVIIRHIPTEAYGHANYVGIDIDTQDYKIIIFDRELTEEAVIKGIRIILQTEKSRQCGNTDSSKR